MREPRGFGNLKRTHEDIDGIGGFETGKQAVDGI